MDLPDPGIELGSPALQADSLLTKLSGKSFLGRKKKTNQFLHLMKMWEGKAEE